MSGRLSVCRQTFFKSLLRQFSLILTKLGTHRLCANMQKNYGRNFRNVAVKIFGEFLRYIGTCETTAEFAE